MQPLLSICIPTYNRAEHLKQTIESIIIQPEFQSGKVEIVVSDNASTDNTEEVCSKYLGLSNFFYSRNNVNIKDQNFPLVLSKASGKLRKLNNDTIKFLPGSLKTICNVVEKYEKERPFIYFFNQDSQEVIRGFHDFILEVSYNITWIAGFTIWENECENISNDVYGCDLSLWQMRKAIDLLYLKDCGIIINQKYGDSVALAKKNLSYGLYQVFYCNYFLLLEPYILNNTFNDSDVSLLKKDILLHFFPYWVVQSIFNSKKYILSEKDNLSEAIVKECKSQNCIVKFNLNCAKQLIKGTLLKLLKIIKVK